MFFPETTFETETKNNYNERFWASPSSSLSSHQPQTKKKKKKGKKNIFWYSFVGLSRREIRSELDLLMDSQVHESFRVGFAWHHDALRFRRIRRRHKKRKKERKKKSGRKMKRDDEGLRHWKRICDALQSAQISPLCCSEGIFDRFYLQCY